MIKVSNFHRFERETELLTSMVGMNRVLIALTLAFLASSALLPVSDGAKKPLSAPRKEDVPYIKCQVCEKLASRLHQLVKEKQEQISPKKVDCVMNQ